MLPSLILTSSLPLHFSVARALHAIFFPPVMALFLTLRYLRLSARRGGLDRIPMAQQRVAIFDVDGTIFRSSLLIAIVERLILVGAFPEKVRDEYEKQKQKWIDREGDYDEYIMAVVKAFLKHIKGMHYK